MLALHENALVDALQNRPDIKNRVRTVGTLPRLFGKELLARYVADAPALYVVPGKITFADDTATLAFTVAGVVRNVAGTAQARKGDQVDIGCDHLLIMVLRAINARRLGECSWKAVAAEMADDEVFDSAGLSVIEMRFVSGSIALGGEFADEQLEMLDNFFRFHADFDLPPHDPDAARQGWLATPPDTTGASPDMTLDVQLPGAST